VPWVLPGVLLVPGKALIASMMVGRLLLVIPVTPMVWNVCVVSVVHFVELMAHCLMASRAFIRFCILSIESRSWSSSCPSGPAGMPGLSSGPGWALMASIMVGRLLVVTPVTPRLVKVFVVIAVHFVESIAHCLMSSRAFSWLARFCILVMVSTLW